MEIGHGQKVGSAQGLADIALALNLAHAQCMAADVMGAICQSR
ncbi:hypothetical protein BN844_0454 [Pseudomonas sp. SHC52]|nr:hypothetical protein BN844_0454 [Pseudomonas sp. SHC52]